jgi:hypothetical protein
MQFELAADHSVIVERVGTICRKRFHEMNEDTGTFDVTKEFVPQTVACVGTFDQSRQVGQDEGSVFSHNDQTEIRIFSGKRIIGDFRLGAR